MVGRSRTGDRFHTRPECETAQMPLTDTEHIVDRRVLATKECSALFLLALWVAVLFEQEELIVGHAGKVLVVDDDDTCREALRRRLEIHGYVVAEARDGVEATEHLETTPWQAVILDYRMPRMNGL